MIISQLFSYAELAFTYLNAAWPPGLRIGGRSMIAPKVFIIGMFGEEGRVWHSIPDFDLLEKNLTVPGFSPLYPQAHCTKDGTICQLVTGAGEINAASTVTALVHSSVFDLSQTYFLVAGTAGISPKRGTLGSVTFARFAVQVALQHEFDAREMPPGFSTGYVPQGSFAPDQYPRRLYGTEVFEVNEDLRRVAVGLAQTGRLSDDERSRNYRAHYGSSPEFAAAVEPPSVIACDTATADTFWSGRLLAEAFEKTTQLFTNGSATYCTTQQEDNGTLAALLRGARAGLVDFSRIIVMRTASNFDRPYPGQDAATNLFLMSGYEVAIKNIRAAGIPVVTDIVSRWDERYGRGIKASNYIGDVFGTLGGAPDFGPGTSLYVG